jgi:alpha-L-fucosidase
MTSLRFLFPASALLGLLVAGAGCATVPPAPPPPPPPALAAASAAATAAVAAAGTTHRIAPGIFQPTWQSLEQNYQCPAWFRDAKFGLWAHWTAQCVPEQGDWYARKMYLQGEKDYDYQVAHYGHPSEVGFMEIDHLWQAEHWDPEKLMDLYVRAGAKYFVALANHHDNFDAYDSKYHAWNSVNVGPKQDIVGTWARVARARGLKFGVTNHSSHAWDWFGPAYGYDPEGPKAGVRYDAFTLTKADGKGKWWDGLDPQDLYTGPNLVMPAGFTTIAEANAWHKTHDGIFTENAPPNDPAFVNTWFLRCQDLIDKYHPDLLYFDDSGLPFGQTGLDIAAHYYNAAAAWNGGKAEVVLNSKKLKPEERSSMVEDYERGSSDEIQAQPWQTDTCIGSWHYDRSRLEKHTYKTVAQVAQMLVNIVSKNGNLLLNIPVRGDGTIDEDEIEFLQGMGDWMAVNGEGIFGSRPWKVSGEGPSHVAGGMFNENKQKFGAQDIRFTTKDGALYAYFLGWPADGQVTIHVLAGGPGAKAGLLDRKIAAIHLLGAAATIPWTQDADGLHVNLPAGAAPSPVGALRLTFE